MVFLGTPTAAVPALRMLVEQTEIALVVTRGDRRRGRSAAKTPSEVKKAAIELGLPVACPEGRVELEQALRMVLPIRVAVVVAYGMLLTPAMLQMATLGFVNVHFSLLPRWRGAAPVAAAIGAGDSATGVSLMRVTEGLDTGPVLASASVSITAQDTRGVLTERLSKVGAELLQRKWPVLWAGGWQERPQREEDATYAPRLSAEDSRLEFDRSAEVLARQIRAMAPRPGTFAGWEGKRMRVLAARWSADASVALQPGELRLLGGDLWCGTGDGGLILDRIQPSGKKVMRGADWARGVRGDLGSLTAGRCDLK